ncbi:MAG: hypothetical protein JJT81_03335 [Rubellimicrobium sp.]|nr:hypothetical protein [Rubellimicrobium sp.]
MTHVSLPVPDRPAVTSARGLVVHAAIRAPTFGREKGRRQMQIPSDHISIWLCGSSNSEFFPGIRQNLIEKTSRVD